jgi:hypothetical protein
MKSQIEESCQDYKETQTKEQQQMESVNDNVSGSAKQGEAQVEADKDS